MSVIRSIAYIATSLAIPASGAQSYLDVGGSDWRWSSIERLRMPRAFVEAMGPVLGITPEGENTHALCESEGTLMLVQNGNSFEGEATKTFNVCETKGGQYFQQPSPVLTVADGTVEARTIYFSFESANVNPCPHRVVVTEIENDRVTGLSGTGWCVLPGHPHSGSAIPFEPPPGGTSKTLSWDASRL